MINEDVIKALAEPIAYRLDELNTTVLKLLGKRIKEIGRLKASDVQKLEQLRRYSGDINRIAKELELISGKNIEDIYHMMNEVSKGALERTEAAYKAKGLKYIPYAENKRLQNLAASFGKITAGTYTNLSRNTALLISDKRGNKVLTSLSKTYKDVIDRAVMSVTSGVADYQSAMRQTLRELADSGLRTKYSPLEGSAGKVVNYASGYSRRLDTAVRQNILWGAKQCYQGIIELTGEEFGSDGYEIDYHANPRSSHADMGGKIYSAGKGVTVKGEYYPSINEIQHLLDDYGCLHFKTPVLLGISVPTYSNEQLKQLKQRDRAKFEYEGREYTGYEASQIQRQLETKARHAKDRQNIAKASGDDVLRREEQARINRIVKKYKEFSEAAGLPTKMERMSVGGYRRVKTFGELKNNINSGIIKKQRYKNMNIIPNADNIQIPIEKFTQYALNPNKDVNKATAFNKALGYNLGNVDRLIHNIQKNIKYYEAKKKPDNGYGERYSVLMSLTGENGKKANVQTAWIIDKDTKKPRLLSAYVTKKNIKE